MNYPRVCQVSIDSLKIHNFWFWHMKYLDHTWYIYMPKMLREYQLKGIKSQRKNYKNICRLFLDDLFFLSWIITTQQPWTIHIKVNFLFCWDYKRTELSYAKLRTIELTISRLTSCPVAIQWEYEAFVAKLVPFWYNILYKTMLSKSFINYILKLKNLNLLINFSEETR